MRSKILTHFELRKFATISPGFGVSKVWSPTFEAKEIQGFKETLFSKLVFKYYHAQPLFLVFLHVSHTG